MAKPARRPPKQTDSYRRRKPLDLFGNRRKEAEASGDEQGSEQRRSAAERADFLVQLGVEAFQARRLTDAAAYLENALGLSADHALAHNCLGLVRRAQGDTLAAIACYERALCCRPDYAEVYNNLGVAWETRGELTRAAAAYEGALQRWPGFAAALNNLGNVLTKLGRAAEAVERLREALLHQPGFSAAHNNLGLALSRLGRNSEAERSFRTALEYQPLFPEAQVNLGNVLRARKDGTGAEACYRAAVQAQPRYAAAWSNLGHVLQDLRRSDESMAAYEQALRINDRCAEAHFGRGNLFLEAGQFWDAVSSFRRALDCDEGYAEAWNNLGSAYRGAGRLDDAEAAFLSALRSNPHLVAAHNNLGNLYRLQERLECAAESYREVLRRQPEAPLARLRISSLCPTVFDSRSAMTDFFQTRLREWESLRGAMEYRDLPELLTAANEAPYNLQFFAENILPLKQAYADIFRYTGPAFHGWPRGEKIRIGCVVTAGHEVAFLRLIWDALCRMNRDEFEVTILCALEATAKFRQAIGESDTPILGIPDQAQRVVPALREQRFDIVYYFEIGTDVRNYFLPYFRLAPVQVTSWGIQVTSGIPQVDCYLSSDLVEPSDADAHYRERLVRARTLLTYQRPVVPPLPGKPREAFGFSRDEHLYLCAQHLGKFHPEFDGLMAEILRRDPKGRIVGTEDRYGYGAKRLRARWERDIPDVASRIVLLPRLAQPDYLSLLAAGDVMLDPLHFGGVSTTYDGLSLDKPIVTLPSRFHRGRYTAGCLTRLGLTYGIARDRADYVQAAVSLACDRSLRDQVAEVIRENKDRVFEDREAVREHERLFRMLVDQEFQP